MFNAITSRLRAAPVLSRWTHERVIRMLIMHAERVIFDSVNHSVSYSEPYGYQEGAVIISLPNNRPLPDFWRHLVTNAVYADYILGNTEFPENANEETVMLSSWWRAEVEDVLTECMLRNIQYRTCLATLEQMLGTLENATLIPYVMQQIASRNKHIHQLIDMLIQAYESGNAQAFMLQASGFAR